MNIYRLIKTDLQTLDRAEDYTNINPIWFRSGKPGLYVMRQDAINNIMYPHCINIIASLKLNCKNNLELIMGRAVKPSILEFFQNGNIIKIKAL